MIMKLFFGCLVFILLFGCVMQGVTETPIQEQNFNKEQLELEYLYADGCEEFCPPMTLIVNELESDFLEEDLIIKYINLTERHTNPEVMKIQEEYKDTNKIQGVPAFALHKGNNIYFYTGYLEKSALKEWICQYYNIKPNSCD
ncbi:MAG: hypothetical protein WC356_06240 [Candidatus Micrarchaeia archaeon]